MRRRPATLIFTITALLVLFEPPGVEGRAEGPLAGRVRDPFGRAVADVEVLVATVDSTLGPVAVLRTDAAGAFFVPRVPRDTYRLAALKDGYLAFIGRLDTRVQGWIDVILHPAPDLAGPDPPSLPADSSWILRLPQRYALRETEATPVAAETAPGPSPGPGFDLLQLEVDHLFAVRSGLGASEANDEVNGTETSLLLASAVGERGQLRVRGFREDLRTRRDSEGEATSSRRDASNLQVAFAYGADPDARLDVAAFYGQEDLQYRPAEVDADTPSTPVEQAERAWGYQGSWTQKLGDESRLALEIHYDDMEVHVPGASPAAPKQLLEADTDHFAGRSVQAGGAYETAPANDHLLEVAFGARLLTSSLAGTRVASPETLTAFDGMDGLSVGFDARDTWELADPFALVYGLSYRHGLRREDPARIVPSFGGEWNTGRARARFVVSYHAAPSWSSGAGTGTIALREDWGGGDVGYDAELELPTWYGVRFVAATGSAPLLPELARGADVRAPLFLSDGNAHVQEHRIALSRPAGRVRATVEVARGEAEGIVAAVLPVDAPVHVLEERSLRYASGRVAIQVAASGTEVLLEYRELLDGSPGLAGARDDAWQRALELRLAQDLLRMRSLGTWRVLLAFRTVSLDPGDTAGPPERDAELLTALGRQVSAGLAVVF